MIRASPELSSNTIRPSIAVVIPVFNEEEAIGPVVGAIPAGSVAEIIVVDGGSSDRTVEVSRAAGARVIVETRRGYGRACATGASATSADIIVFLDGDGSDDASAIAALVEPILRGDADLVLGTRATIEAGALPIYAQVGNKMAAKTMSLLWRQRVSDLPSFKAMRRRDLVILGMTEATYGWTIELIVKAARQRMRIREIPLTYRQRQGGVSKVSGNLQASLKAAVAIMTVLIRHGFSRPGPSLDDRASLVE